MAKDERTCFFLDSFPGAEFRLRIPGRHCVLDAAAALALTSVLVKKEFGEAGWTPKRIQSAAEALEAFSGSRRRSEILGEKGGVLFMDDYGHHPTAIAATLRGLKEFYPRRRLVLSFMSHTYTRTAALLDDFAASLLPADVVVLHKIYASAREVYSGGVNGRSLYEKTKALFVKEQKPEESVLYVDEPLDALPQLKALLREGDLFITMGAGDNWTLGKKLFAGLDSEFDSERADNRGVQP
jgi:UDP-N-acetylmuramate--alanine ligase